MAVLCPFHKTFIFAHQIFDSKPNMVFQVPMIFQSSSNRPPYGVSPKTQQLINILFRAIGSSHWRQYERWAKFSQQHPAQPMSMSAGKFWKKFPIVNIQINYNLMSFHAISMIWCMRGNHRCWPTWQWKVQAAFRGRCGAPLLWWNKPSRQWRRIGD